MSSTQHERVSELFLAARKLAAAVRARYLDEACGEDTALRSEVESLLSHDSEQSAFLEAPALGGSFNVAESDLDTVQPAAAGDVATSGPSVASADAMPQRIASYRIIEVLGEGGMGVVYLAEQDNPQRRVALKLLKAGMSSPGTLRRFEYEAQVLGRLQHPGIAQVFEAGTADTGSGRHAFFAMEYVKGRPLGAHAKAEHLGTRRRLELMMDVCDAVQHAHQKGVIHRDLKPANILVNEAGRPKVLDFGVARAIDPDVQMTTLRTNVGQLIGTLPYMSPEQVTGDPDELDTRSDVYALGVILYELLAGRPPYDIRKRTLHEAVRIIREEEPLPLSSVDRVFRGDVATIVAKALEKDRERRYASASDLSADLGRYLRDEPIQARPASRIYQLRKFARRHRAVVLGAITTLLTLVAGVVVATTFALRETEQRQLAEEKSAEAERNAEMARASERKARASEQTARANERRALAVSEYLSEMFHSLDPYRGGTELKLVDVVDRAAQRIEESLGDQPDVEASLRNEFGSVYLSLGRLDDAEPHYEKALELRRRVLPAEHPETLDSLNNLGQLRTGQGRFAEAKRLLIEALAGRRSVLGPDDPKTLITMNNLALAVQYQGQLEEAEHLLRETLERQQRVLGDDHTDTLTTMANIAGLLRQHRRFDEAEPLLRTVLEGFTRAYGAEHPRTLLAVGALAVTLKQDKKFEQAEALYRRRVETSRRVLGEKHPDTLIATANLAKFLWGRQQLDEAVELYRLAYAGCRESIGDDHPNTRAICKALADVLQERGEPAEAEEVLRGLLDALGGFEADDASALDVMGRLAIVLRAQKKHAADESVRRKLLAARRRVSGETDPATLDAWYRLARALSDQGKFSEARSSFEQLLGQARQHLPADDWRLARYQGGLGRCLSTLQHFDQAEAQLTAALEGMEAALGAKHRRTRDAIQDLIRLYDAWPKPDQAAAYRERAARQEREKP
ncbi:MAG: serine/threonine protein kinase [Planctomycetes bacterium]|nr:serine/threonine protein kinase [Planctomycetota bacterium]